VFQPLSQNAGGVTHFRRGLRAPAPTLFTRTYYPFYAFWSEGKACFLDTHTLRVSLRGDGERRVTANIILIATGSSPYHPTEISFDFRRLHNSDSILRMLTIPKSLAGIGLEFASIFCELME
jgi:hypothetical protein